PLRWIMAAKKISASDGAVEYADGGLRYFIGPSRVRHYFNSFDEGERRAAMLGARSMLGPLPSGITPVATPPAFLSLMVRGRQFLIVISQVQSYVKAREEAQRYLAELHQQDFAERQRKQNAHPTNHAA